MLRVHDIEGIGVGAHINEKEIKIRIKTLTQKEGKRGESNPTSSNIEAFTFEKQTRSFHCGPGRENPL
jgi:hypothetical protein